MLLKYFYDKNLAQASYMIGCQATGEAMVIDASRDIAPYLEVAQEEGLRISLVTETHIHADYVSGSRELAHQTGATLLLSKMGDETWQYQAFSPAIQLIQDKDEWRVGNIGVQVIATPGHTPEHVVFMITDHAAADEPLGIFTGDCLFIGSVGRPDLLEKVVGIDNSMVAGARQQFHNIRRLSLMPDYLQVWPGHGAGSACGKALGSLPSSTLGYEKRFNPAFQFVDEDAFVAWLLDGQPEPPTYFAQMKVVNKVGPSLLEELPSPTKLPADRIHALLADEQALVLDTRNGNDYCEGHIAQTIHIPASSKNFNTHAGWLLSHQQSLYLIAEEETFPALLRQLRAVGFDRVEGYFEVSEVAHLFTDTIDQISPKELAKIIDKVQLIDVRHADEFAQQRIEGATHIPLGHIVKNLDAISRDKPIVLQCSAGIRSQIAASLLQKHGFSQVINLVGGLNAWQEEQLPVNTEKR